MGIRIHHTQELWHSSTHGNITIVEEWAGSGDAVELTARFEGRDFRARSERFDDALQDLLAQLPGGTTPVLCGACRLCFEDLFGGTSGRDSLSCFRDRKELARDLETNLKHASGEALAHMGRRLVEAFHSCAEFEPRARSGEPPAGRT
ncbi:MAG: hypothetical protein HYZ53_17045 [Planctomycetes bacterium]|nr:hypothetical protein [Planctomycetota bacterium]